MTRPKKKATTAPSEEAAGGTAPVQINPAFRPVVAAFARKKEVGLGRMFSSSSVLNVNGKIFAMLARGKLVAKLPKERVAALVSDGTGQFFDPGHGRLMKEWVAVADTKAPWIDLAREAYEFVKRGGDK